MNDILFANKEQRSRARRIKKALFSAAGAFGLGGLMAMRFDEHFLRIERRDMPLPGLGADLDGATLAHVSDLHASPIVLQRYLRQCVERINELNVDFVAITGDFITGPHRYARRVARILADLNPRIAAVACLGNHDYGLFHPGGLGGVRGLGDYLAERLGHADIFVMLNESRVFSRGGSSIQFVGLEDYWSRRYDPELAFEVARRHLPTIALCHNPDPAGEIARLGAHWVLAGHTHGRERNHDDSRLGNMVMPVSRREYFGGHYELADGTHLYVNRGLGYARRVNINSRPEITIFTLRPAETAD